MSVYPGPEEPRGGSTGAGRSVRTPAPESVPFTDPTPTGPRTLRPTIEPAVKAEQAERENRILRLAFAPLHKRAFGIAVGTACALFTFAVTAVHVLFDIPGAIRIELLRAYFLGYEVSWLGALIGTVWAFWVGFIGGWFVAFCRNLVIAINMFMTRTRAELNQTREFLDHI